MVAKKLNDWYVLYEIYDISPAHTGERYCAWYRPKDEQSEVATTGDLKEAWKTKNLGEASRLLINMTVALAREGRSNSFLIGLVVEEERTDIHLYRRG